MKAICRDCLWTGEQPVSRCPGCGSPRVARHEELSTLTMAHMDCDAFYASVEKRDRPELRDRPVLVGGGRRGVVSAACYIARQYGVKSAMPMFKALKACPDAVVIKPDFSRYVPVSKAIFDKLRALTPLVQTLSLDEAWLDLAGTERLNGGPPALQLVKVQREIERDVGLTVSIGLAPNKFLAKIASEMDKPRGFSVIGVGEAQAFLADKPVSIIPGVGPAFARSLNASGYLTVGDIAAADLKTIAGRFGEHGVRLHHLAHGRDSRPVDPEGERKGMSKETTFFEDLTDLRSLEDELWPLCEQLAAKARRSGVASRVVVLKLRTADFRRLTRRRTLAEPVQTARVLFSEAREMLRAEVDGRRAYRLIGIGMAELFDVDASAQALFETAGERVLKTETAVDALRSKFGDAAVVSGRVLKR
ncbi:MAG: DNA polymerase IV [Caulobacteraceae bacterium]|nr:DNA polymerase IV [Caulobacteraceae bacterium]